jgi:RimJ/RimL family protein N-acetyltransferase
MSTPAVRLDAVECADIRGHKTRLRPMRAGEAPLFYEWATDPEVQPFWGGRGHYRDLDGFLRDWQPHYFDGSQPDRGRCFTVESLPAGGRADARPIGMIAYNRIDVSNRSTEIDIVIGDPAYRDRGHGTDAIRAFLAFLFDTVGLHRVWLATYDYNVRAQRAYEKAGFVREGVMRQSDWVDGHWVDSVIYGILEDEFRRGDTQGR